MGRKRVCNLGGKKGVGVQCFERRGDRGEGFKLDVKTAFLHRNLEEVIYMKQSLGYEQGNKEFDMKELGEAKKILGMEIIMNRSCKILRVSQFGYVSKILNNFRIDNGKSVKMPLGGHFKPSLKDCTVRDCDVERMSKVPYANAEAVKWILKYFRGTANVGLVYGTNRDNHVDVTGFVDSDYAKDPDKGREVLEAKTVKVLKVGTEHNAVDALMKVVPGLKLQHCLELLNVGVG
nr:hypothetical protein [Tanacetum cinerariifolium]